MSEWTTIHQLVEILEGDEDLVVRLCEAGIVTRHEQGFMPEEVARVLVCRTLVRELDIADASALEVILRLREQLLDTRHRLAAMARELRRLQRER
jgi:hypothetical protein